MTPKNLEQLNQEAKELFKNIKHGNDTENVKKYFHFTRDVKFIEGDTEVDFLKDFFFKLTDDSIERGELYSIIEQRIKELTK